MHRLIFMKTFTNNDKYPFEFYCNATGDLFIPSSDPNVAPRDLTDMSELPYPLQYLYEVFWSEDYGWLTYMVKADTGYGMMMEREFSADNTEDYDAQMDALYEQVAEMAGKIEKSLSVFCPKAEVFLGRETGLEGCHELCVFVPADERTFEIERMVYILTLTLKDDCELPFAKTELDERGFRDFQEKYSDFSRAPGICKYYADQPVVAIHFSDNSLLEPFEFDVLVAKKAMEQDGEIRYYEIEARMEQAIKNILRAAKDAGTQVYPDEPMVRACNIMFPHAWEFPKPVFSIDLGALEEELNDELEEEALENNEQEGVPEDV